MLFRFYFRALACLAAVALATSALMVANRATACPFCSAVSQTLSEEMAAMDTAAIAQIVLGSETDSDAEFEILNVIRGDSLVRTSQKLRVNYFGKAKPEQKFLLMGVDPPDLLWSSPLPVTAEAIEYVQSLTQLPKDSVERLKFFLKFLEHSESLMARDAYDEFAKAPYDSIKALKDAMDREKLIGWIRDTSLPPDRKRLYLVMLGVCGKPEDAAMLKEMLKSENDNVRAGLDAMIACYLTLIGDEGLPLINELFLSNKQSQYADTYAAIMALRFHGTEGGVLEKESVLKSMRLILDRPELADLVIPDLARWEDWTQIEKMVELFKSADEKSSWVRVPVINYLRACPLATAEKQLEKLKDLDPAAFKRATSFFPVPKASSDGGTDSSSNLPLDSSRNLVQSFSDPQLGSGTTLARISSESLPISSGETGLQAPAQAAQPNRSFAAVVLTLVSATFGLAMWLSISGAGGSSR